MKNLKKAIALFLCLITVFSVMSISASAASVSVGTAKTGTSATYTIKNSGSGKMLNVYGSKSASNTNVTIYKSDGTKGQKCKFISNGTKTYNKVSYNKYIIEFACASSCALNVYGSAAKNNSNVNIWKKSGNTTQAWILEYVTSPAKGYIIRSANNPKYVLTANGTSNSSNVCLKTYSSTNKNQVWTCSAFSYSTKNTTSSSSSTTSSTTANTGKITTAQIKAVCDKYGYANGKYWTIYQNNGKKASGTWNASKTYFSNRKNCCSTINKTVKNDLYATNNPVINGNYYKSYNYQGQYECHGFACYVMAKVVQNATGKNNDVIPRNGSKNGWTKIPAKNVTELKIGDIVRVNGSNAVHSAIVYAIDSNGKITFLEAGGGSACKIRLAVGFDFSTKYYTLQKIKDKFALEYVYRYTG